jgi:hypothetical protein
MDKEPLVMTMTSGPGGASGAPAGGGTFTTTVGGGGGTVTQHTTILGDRGASAPQMTPAEREKFMAEMDARRKEAEARRRVVEYRVFYADYQPVNGVLLPHRIQRSIDGKPTEEMVFDQLKVNPKIDPKKFLPVNK